MSRKRLESELIAFLCRQIFDLGYNTRLSKAFVGKLVGVFDVDTRLWANCFFGIRKPTMVRSYVTLIPIVSASDIAYQALARHKQIGRTHSGFSQLVDSMQSAGLARRWPISSPIPPSIEGCRRLTPPSGGSPASQGRPSHPFQPCSCILRS